MRKLSQKELLDEGALRFMGDVLKAGGKALAKKVSPSLYGDVAKVASGAKKLYKKHFNSPVKFIESWKEQYPEIISNISNIQTINKGTRDIPLHVASFVLELRDPSTNDAVNVRVPMRNIPIKETRDKEGNTTYKVSGNQKELDQIIKTAVASYPEVEAAMQEFGKQVLQSVEQGKKAPNKTPQVREEPAQDGPVDEPVDEPGDEPAQEEPTQDEPVDDSGDEPTQEEPAQEEPVQVIDSDVVSLAKQAINTLGARRGFEDKQAIKDVKEYMQDNLSIDTDQAKVTYKDRVERGTGYNPNLSGVKLTNKEARNILATESKKSQKSLLKHLQSLSR